MGNVKQLLETIDAVHHVNISPADGSNKDSLIVYKKDIGTIEEVNEEVEIKLSSYFNKLIY